MPIHPPTRRTRPDPTDTGRHAPRRGGRAGAARRRILSAATVLATVAAAGMLPAMPALAASPAGAPASVGALPAALAQSARLASFDSQMLSLVNGARSAAGAPALRSSGGLTELALWWSNRLAAGATGYQLAHNPNAWSMCASYGAADRTAWAENVAAFSEGASASAVFDAYMASPGHRANILNPTYRYVGIGTVSGSHGAFDTMEFTDRVDGSSAPQPAPRSSSPAPQPSTRPAPAPTTRRAAPAGGSPADQRPSSHQPPATPVPARAATPAPRPQPPLRPSRGAVLAAFGDLPAADVTFAIRDATCASGGFRVTTGRDGLAAVTATPGAHCAVAVSVPRGVQTPEPVRFTVRTGHEFQVTVDHLDPVTVWWRTRGTWLAQPV